MIGKYWYWIIFIAVDFSGNRKILIDYPRNGINGTYINSSAPALSGILFYSYSSTRR